MVGKFAMSYRAWNRPFPILISDLRGLRYRDKSAGMADKVPKVAVHLKDAYHWSLQIFWKALLEQRVHGMFARETLRGCFYGTMGFLDYLLEYG